MSNPVDQIVTPPTIVTADSAHAAVTESNKLAKPKTKTQQRKDSRTKRHHDQLKARKITEHNVDTIPISNKEAATVKPLIKKATYEFKSIWESPTLLKGREAYTFFKKNPWGKRIGRIGLGVVGFNLAAGMFRTVFRANKPAIPDEYEKGYDVMNESLTDFGSPLKLAKAAQKIITPYYSTVRQAVFTTTGAVQNSNISLLLSKNAIRHTRY